MLNAMLISLGLPSDMWGEAILFAYHLLNRIPLKKSYKTSYELQNGYKPNLSYLKVWGCLAKVEISDV